jgi:hypothetical protein
VFCSGWVKNDQHGSAPLRWAINELQEMAKTSRLRHVILIIDVGGIHQIEWEQWKDLDGALKGSSDAHCNLEEVSLILCVPYIGGPDWIISLVKEQMPLSQAAGCLTVSVSTRQATSTFVYDEKRRQLSHLTPTFWV